MTNPFDQFDAPEAVEDAPAGNPFDQFDEVAPKAESNGYGLDVAGLEEKQRQYDEKYSLGQKVDMGLTAGMASLRSAKAMQEATGLAQDITAFQESKPENISSTPSPEWRKPTRSATSGRPGEHVDPLSGNPLVGFDNNPRAVGDIAVSDALERKIGALNATLRASAANTKKASAIPMSPVAAAAMEAKTLDEAWEIVKVDPIGFIADTGVRSAPFMVEPIVAGIVGSAGGLPGFMAATGLGSAHVDYAAELAEALQHKGVDTTNPAAVKAALLNKSTLADIKSDARTHAAFVGLFDGLTAGIASKTLAPKVVTQPMAREFVNLVNQMGANMAGGMAGEYTGQLAQGRDIKWGEVLAEGAGEMMTAPTDIMTATAAGLRDAKTAKQAPGTDGPPANLKAEADRLAKEGAANPFDQFDEGYSDAGTPPGGYGLSDFDRTAAQQAAARQTEIDVTMHGVDYVPATAKPSELDSAGTSLGAAPGEATRYENGIDYTAAPAAPGYGLEGPREADRRVQRDTAISANEQVLGDVVLPEGLDDARMKRLPYRQGLESLAGELTKGGGVTYVRDEQGNVTGRTPSVNPQWFQTLTSAPETAMSVDDVQAAVKKALAGEKLGVRQSRVVGAMLDTITGEREQGVDHARAQLEAARKTARDGFGYTVPNAGEVFAEQEYAPDWNAEQRMLSELTDEAMQVDADGTEAAIERMAIQGASTWDIMKALDAIITGEANEAGQVEEVGAEQGGPGRAGEGQGRPEGRAPAGAQADQVIPAAEQAQPTEPLSIQTTPSGSVIVSGASQQAIRDQLQAAGVTAKSAPYRDGLMFGPKNAEQVVQALSQRVAPAASPMAPGAIEPEGRRRMVVSPDQERRNAERRANIAERRRVSDLSLDEARAELLTSEKASISNERAYKESPRKAHQAFFDLDNFKATNTRLSYSGADQLLNIVGQVMREEQAADGVIAYHFHGDEFVAEHDDLATLKAFGDRVRERLNDVVATVTHENGQTITERGIKTSYGTGTTLADAESSLKRDKAARAAAGVRSERGGEHDRVAEQTAARQQGDDHPPAESVAEPKQTPADAGVSVSGDFIPTHELPDGTPVRGTDEPGVWVDAEGNEWEDGNAMPIAPSVDDVAHQAATSPQNDRPEPTEAQRQAGNYAKGHLRLHGLDISIENPAGSKRRPEWPALKHHYGYIRGTEGRDGDHVDVFLGPQAENAGAAVVVIDQLTAAGKFDEHKVMLGFASTEDALRAYFENYEPGWDRVRSYKALTVDQLKAWVDGGNHKQPAGVILGKSKREALSKEYGREATAVRDVRGRQDADRLELEAPDNTQQEAAGAAPQPRAENVATAPAAEGQNAGVATAKSPEVSTSLADEQKAAAILDAANVTGKERLDIMRDFREGKHTLADLEAAYPAKAGDRQAEKASAAQEKKPSQNALTEKQGAAQEAVKQKADTLQDAGEELWYNRRNLMRNGIRWDDIAGLNDTLKLKEATKAKVWPKMDYEALVDAGMNPLTAHFIKQAYDAIPTKPSGTSDEQIKAYVDAVNDAREKVISWAKDGDAQARLAEWIGNAASARLGRGGSSLIDMARSQSSIPTDLIDAIFPLADGVERRFRFRDSNPLYDKLKSFALGNKFIRAIQYDMDSAVDAMKAIDKGWPKPQEAWQRQGYSVAETSKMLRSYYSGENSKGKPYTYLHLEGGKQRVSVLFADKTEAAAFADALKPWLALSKRGEIIASTDTREQAIEALREATKREGKGGDIESFDLAMAVREGVERRQPGEDVDAQRLVDTFGFRGVNYGNWVNGTERQAFTNQAYDALLDLSDLMGIPPKAVSLNGMLGLAFGAQGRGGTYAAHFVPGVNEINLTKTAGAGALAHEWAHAVDHYFATLAGKARASDPFATHLPERELSDLRPEVRSAFKAVVDAMRGREETPAEMAARIKQASEQDGKSLERWIEYFRRQIEAGAKPEAKEKALADFDALAARMRKGDLGDGYVNISGRPGRQAALTGSVREVIAAVRDLYREAVGRVPKIDDVKALDSVAGTVRFAKSADGQAMRHQPQQVKTDYYRKARGMDASKAGEKVYWSQPTEMFARAFQSWAIDRLRDQSARNDFLSRPQPGPDAEGAIAAEIRQRYPQGEERTAINKAIDTLVGAIETKETEQGVAMFSRRTVTGQDDKLTAGWTLLAEHDPIWQQPTAAGKTLEAIAAEIDPRLSVTDAKRNYRNSIYDGVWYVSMPDGKAAAVFEKNGEVWIDASSLEVGASGGTKLYGLVGAYAHNTGKLFIGDPNGISTEGKLRRLENMISLALKYGTTDFIAPHPDQIADFAKLPSIKKADLTWKPGMTENNLRYMLLASHDNVVNAIPEAANVEYDAEQGAFVNRVTGQRIGEADFVRMSKRAAGTGKSPVFGGSSVARTAVTNSLARAKGGQEWGSLLGRLRADLRAEETAGTESALRKLLYSLSKETPAQSGVSASHAVDRVQGWMDAITARLPGSPKVNVIATMDDAPADVRAYDEQQRSEGAAGDVEGFYYRKTGEVFLVLDGIGTRQGETTQQAIIRVWAHEVLGHASLRGAFGKELVPILKEVAIRRRADVKEKAEQYGLDFKNETERLAAAEEVLAELAETRPDHSIVRRTIEAIRRVLRNLYLRLPKAVRQELDGRQFVGWVNGMTDSEMVERFILPARGFIETGLKAGEYSAATAAAMSRSDQMQTQAFRRWFGDSKVVDENGKPLVVYHGTNASFDEFSADFLGEASDHPSAKLGFYFTADPMAAGEWAWSEDGGNVMPSYLSIKNPMRLTGEWFRDAVDESRLFRDMRKEFDAIKEKAIADGHDGIIVSAIDGATGADLEWSNDVYIAFEPGQIKSAVGNRGDFDQGSPSTVFSRSRSRAHLGDLTDAQQQALRNVGGIVDPKSPKQHLQELRQKFAGRIAQGLVDQFAPLKSLDSEAYTLARLSKGSDGALEALLMFGNLNLKDGVTDADAGGTGLIEVLQQLQGEQQRFMWWIAANRAEGLKAEGRENLFTDEDIASLKALNRGKMPDGQDRDKIYAAVHKEFSRISKEVMDIAEASSLIDPESRKLWERDFYIPFYRVMEEGMAGPTVKGGLVKQYAFKRLKGGTEKLNADLLANTLMNWGHLLAASAKNRAAAAALDAAEEQGVAVKLTGPQKGSVYVQGMREVEIPAGKKYLDGGIEKVSDGTATMMEHGEIHYLVLDPLIMDAITSLEWTGFNNLPMNAARKAKHWLTMGVTANPTFKIRNLIRDSLQSIAIADMSYNAAGNVKQGWKVMSDKKGQTYASLLAGGGIIRFGTMLEGNRASHVHKLINAGVHENTILDTRDKLKAAMTKAVDWYNDLGDRSEGANRAAIYLQQLEKGATHAEASLAARDLLDFSMGGSWGAVRALTQTVPFLNARMQGLYKLGRSAKADKRRFGAVVLTMAMASIALMLAYKDDEDWKRREDWDRDNYWWFKIGNTAYRIPKPFEVGALATLAERSAELWVSDEMTAGRFYDRLKFLLGSTFAFNPTPQLIKPAVDVYANHDPFTGRPIETMGMERLSKPERFTHRTSETAKLLGKAGNVTGLSPAQIDHLIRGYFGWVGTFATGAVDHLADAAGLRPTAPTMKLKDVFVAGNFVETLPAGSSRYVTVFYDQAKEINEYFADIKAAEKRGDKEKYRAIFEAHKGELALHDAVSGVQRDLAELTQLERAVRFDTRMSAADKRAKLDKIAASKDALATRAVRKIEQRRNQ